MTTQIGMHFRDAPGDVERPKTKTQNKDADQHRKAEPAGETWLLHHTVGFGEWSEDFLLQCSIVNHFNYMCYSQ